MKFATALLACALLLPSAAYADTVFTVTNATTGAYNGALTGTITINTVNSTITNSDVTYMSSLGTFHYTGPGFVDATAIPGYVAGEVSTANGQSDFAFLLDTPTLVGYTGSPICSATVQCNDVLGNPVPFTSGVVVYDAQGNTQALDYLQMGSLSPVPEPGSLTLVATGAFGVVTAIRRRFAA